MTAPAIHPERVGLIATLQQNPANTEARSAPLPPDVAEARKTRINNDLVTIFKLPVPKDTTPSVQGIGLYTHVAGPSAPAPQFPHERYTSKSSTPVFLKLGGPRGISRDTNGLDGPVSEDVMSAWKDVQEAVDKEEEQVGRRDMTLDQLKQKYGALDLPVAQPRTESRVQQMTDHMQDMAMTNVQRMAGAVGEQGSARRPSLGAGRTSETVMGGIDQERRGSAPAAQGSGTGHTYEASRDPRDQRLRRQ